MAWQTITYKCGHEDSVQLYGPYKDRDSKAEWMAQGVCPACYKEQMQAKRKAEGPAFAVRRSSNSIIIECYQESYGIKDELKARGYRFNDQVIIPGTVTLADWRTTKGWSKSFPAPAPDGQDEWVAAVSAEFEWILGSGWKIEDSTAGPMGDLMAPYLPKAV